MSQTVTVKWTCSGVRSGAATLYRDTILPRLVDCACGTAELHRWRERVTEGLSGEILEIGFGSGLNLSHYRDGVTLIHAIEPSGGARRLSRSRAAHCAVVHHEHSAESLPLADASCDGALSTFTLCTIPDVARALDEVRRVVRPGGRFHVLEHGIAPDRGVAAWQRRLDPLQGFLAGGCHLTRDPPMLLERAGFEIESVQQRYARGPKPWTYLTSAMAVRR